MNNYFYSSATHVNGSAITSPMRLDYIQGHTQRVTVVHNLFANVAAIDLGGVGPSGMGAYHGADGFKRFSHAKAVFKQTKFNLAEMMGMRPPYGEKLVKFARSQLK